MLRLKSFGIVLLHLGFLASVVLMPSFFDAARKPASGDGAEQGAPTVAHLATEDEVVDASPWSFRSSQNIVLGTLDQLAAADARSVFQVRSRQIRFVYLENRARRPASLKWRLEKIEEKTDDNEWVVVSAHAFQELSEAQMHYFRLSLRRGKERKSRIIEVKLSQESKNVR